jgi:6-phosphogluconolactonase
MADTVFRWHEFADADAMADGLATAIADHVSVAIARSGSAVFGASGGSTPFPAYRRLADMPLPWSAFKVVIVDERWVPPGDPDHNETRIRASLLARAGDKARCLGLWSEAPTVQAAAALADARVAQLARPLDVVLLGMGLDGHIASLFASGDNYARATDPDCPYHVMAMVPAAGAASPAHARLTLTLPILLRSRAILLALTGDDKRALLERAIADGDASALPVASLFTAGHPAVDVYWSAK